MQKYYSFITASEMPVWPGNLSASGREDGVIMNLMLKLRRMKSAIAKYQLKAGFLVAVLFPGIFVFSESEPSNILIRFVSSFICIFILWVVSFVLVDFRNQPHQKSKRNRPNLYVRIALSFLFAIAFYLVAGFFIDHTGSLLSQVEGEQMTSFRAWFFLCLRIMLFNALILLIKYLFDSGKERQEIQMENEILRRENLNALHETLKQQVNPHFLFNSLNTLKSLVKLNSDQAVDFISELPLFTGICFFISISKWFPFVKKSIFLSRICIY